MYSDIAALDRARNSQSLRKSPLGTAKLIWLLENFRQPTAKFLLRLSLKVLRSKTSMRLCRGGQRPLFSRHGSMGLTPLALAGTGFEPNRGSAVRNGSRTPRLRGFRLIKT